MKEIHENMKIRLGNLLYVFVGFWEKELFFFLWKKEQVCFVWAKTNAS